MLNGAMMKVRSTKVRLYVISAGLARRLACEGGVIPAVYAHGLGGPSQVLDLGRRRRLHTTPQRIAMTIRDQGCTAEDEERHEREAERFDLHAVDLGRVERQNPAPGLALQHSENDEHEPHDLGTSTLQLPGQFHP